VLSAFSETHLLLPIPKKFRRVRGWRDIEKLIMALSDLENKEEAAAERVA
jgi:hypothetical protein